MGVSALAHPASPTDWATWSSIQVTPDQVVVVAILEMPEAAWTERKTATGQDADTLKAAVWSELADDLSLTLDGKDIATQWLPVWTKANGSVNHHGTVSFMLQQTVPLRSGVPHTLELTHEAMVHKKPQHTAWYEVEGWSASHSATGILPSMDPNPASRHEVWTDDPRLRTVVVQLAPLTEP